MPTRRSPARPGCAVEVTLAVIGGKWKPVILYRLQGGAKRFGELRRSFQGISQRSLTMQLRELEADGIVSRKVFAEVPPRVEYALTEYGRTLSPVLDAMKAWGEEFRNRIAHGKPERRARPSSPNAKGPGIGPLRERRLLNAPAPSDSNSALTRRTIGDPGLSKPS